MKKFQNILLYVAVIPAIYYVLMTAALRVGLIGFGDVPPQLAWLVPILFAAGGLLVLLAGWNVVSGRAGQSILAILFALVSFAMAMGPVQMRKMAQDVPPIHDISTDVQDPPAFVVTAAERGPKENPAAYDTEQTAQQLEAYEDIKPIKVSASPKEAFDACLEAAKQMGLKIADENRGEGRIEATATTRWFGFKDDVVFRIRAGVNGGTVIDIRSKSRIGQSDLGANAKRIRDLRDRILVELGQQ